MREWKRASQEQHKQQKAERERARYHADLEEARRKERARPSREPERQREYYARHRDTNREKLRDYAREYYHRTGGGSNEIRRRASQARRARKAGCIVSKVEFQAIYERDNGICGICGKPVPPSELSFDHVIPLARGGPHTADNLQVAHLRCNKQKGAKL